MARTCAVLLLLGVAACSQDAPAKPSLDGIRLITADLGNEPISRLSPEWQSRFNGGDALFDATFLDTQGLGPTFIRASCAGCHKHDSRGPGTVRKLVLLGDDGRPLADQSGLQFGHTVRPQTAAGATRAITVPDDDSRLLVTVRMPPAVFGRGYIEAIADSEIQRVESEQADRDDGITGHINWVRYASETNVDTRFHDHALGEQLIGRFGLKARIATLDDFTADAFQGDMGLTSDMRPDELPTPAETDDELPGIDLPPETINSVADYMRLLRLPPRKAAITGPTTEGSKLFESTGCATCHVPTLHTVADYPVPQLADIDAPIYSDLLVHDMGPDFADGLIDYGASSSEWRTAPLIGVRLLNTTYLHDGRAATLEQAIMLHGSPDSEAAASANAFAELDDASRKQLLEFVSAL